MTAVLHTWGQRLDQHLHLHCLVPGGVLCADGTWQSTRGTYLFPVRALSRHFRGAMVSTLRRRAKVGDLHRIAPGEIDRVLAELMDQSWVVYTRHCLSHTDAVIEYLARYSHRIAVTNARIQAVDEAGVRLRYKDYRDGDRHKTLQLTGDEFVRRMLLHVLPKGFMRIRHYGFLAGCRRATKLRQIREALAQPETPVVLVPEAISQEYECHTCPLCRVGALRWVADLAPTAAWARRRR